MENQSKGVSKILIWALLIIVIAGGFLLWKYRFSPTTSSTSNPGSSPSNNSTSNPSSSPTATPTATVKAESWTPAGQIVFSDTTSTDTHKVSNQLYRMYRQSAGVYYTESTDGVTWGSMHSTGVTEPSNAMVSNPNALMLPNGSWIMIYEQAPRRQPGQTGNQIPGPSNQRDLYLATSTDGQSFTKVGRVVDSSIEDNYFASVPELVLLPDQTLRMYYVCRGDQTCSRLSTDNGRTWTKEAGIRLGNMAVDPDVLYHTVNGQTQWVMYYSILDPARNGLYKATSTDGLNWTPGNTLILPRVGSAAQVDPDVFPVGEANYIMYYGQSVSNSSTGGESINLYRAALQDSIF